MLYVVFFKCCFREVISYSSQSSTKQAGHKLLPCQEDCCPVSLKFFPYSFCFRTQFLPFFIVSFLAVGLSESPQHSTPISSVTLRRLIILSEPISIFVDFCMGLASVPTL